MSLGIHADFKRGKLMFRENFSTCLYKLRRYLQGTYGSLSVFIYQKPVVFSLVYTMFENWMQTRENVNTFLMVKGF